MKTDTRYVEAVNPATGETFARFPVNTVEELRSAVMRARQAQRVWGSYSFDERKQYVLRIRDAVRDNADHIVDTVTRSTGKPRLDALTTEVMASVMATTYYATHAKKILRPKSAGFGSLLTFNKRTVVENRPLGVVGIISPWNYPFGIPMHEVMMALMAGNAVILKVATHVVAVGEEIRAVVEAAHLPDGLFAHINLPGSVAGDAFIESGIDKLFFTGSTAVGKKLMTKAAERLLPLSLELGGNDAMIVCADADLERAAGGALWAGLSNTGQSCAAVERIYVEAPVYDQFLTLLKTKMAALRQGYDTDYAVEIGSMTTQQQLEKVRELLTDARAKGAAVTTLPDKNIRANPSGLFHPAAILENVDDTMRVLNEEIFGPLLPVATVANIEEAIQRANRSNVGLTASVWSRNSAKARTIARQLEVGTVTINDHLMSHGLAETPWGGPKESGIGRTHGELGLRAMTQPQAIVRDIVPFLKRNMWWYPYNKGVYDGMKAGMEVVYGKGLVTRVRNLGRLILTFLRSFSVS